MAHSYEFLLLQKETLANFSQTGVHHGSVVSFAPTMARGSNPTHTIYYFFNLMKFKTEIVVRLRNGQK